MSNHTTSNSEVKKLYRSRDNRSWLGVCGGIAEYLHADVTPIRLLWVVCTIFSGFIPGLLAYIVAAIIIPNKPESE